MVKITKILVFLTLVLSCANSNTSNFKLQDNQKAISTYKLYSSWLGDGKFNSNKKIDYEVIEESKDIYDNYLQSIQHIRFYEKNKMMLFSLPRDTEAKNYTISTVVGTVGTYEARDGVLYLKYKLSIGHSPKLIRSEAVKYGDTLHLIEKILNHRTHKIYIKVDN